MAVFLWFWIVFAATAKKCIPSSWIIPEAGLVVIKDVRLCLLMPSRLDMILSKKARTLAG
jgi:hypothetical protein